MKSKNFYIKFICVFLLSLHIASTKIKAKDTLLTNAIIHTISGPTYSPGFVLINEDQIKSVGPVSKQPKLKNTTTINLKKQHLFPGIIATTTALGLMEIAAVRATVDTNEVGTYRVWL